MVDTRSTRMCVYGKVKYHTATRDVSLNHCIAIRFACDAYWNIDFRSLVSRRLVNTVCCGYSRSMGSVFSQCSRPAKARRRLVKNSHLCAQYGRVGGGVEQRGKLKWILQYMYVYTSKDAIYFTRSSRAGNRPVWETQRRWQLYKSDLKC